MTSPSVLRRVGGWSRASRLCSTSEEDFAVLYEEFGKLQRPGQQAVFAHHLVPYSGENSYISSAQLERLRPYYPLTTEASKDALAMTEKSMATAEHRDLIVHYAKESFHHWYLKGRVPQQVMDVLSDADGGAFSDRVTLEAYILYTAQQEASQTQGSTAKTENDTGLEKSADEA